jgi:transmembrane sensor
MKAGFEKTDDSNLVAQAAAEWTLRHDRGLTAAEQDEFSQWLAADPRHRAAFAEHRWGWDELDRLAGLQTSVHAVPDPDLLKPAKARLLRFPVSLSLLAAAAAVALGLFVWWSRSEAPAVSPPVVAPPVLALIELRELPDGSTVELNRGAVVTEHYTPIERRVRLVRGEAHFKVAKDASRPFLVEAAGVAVRAVGTAFNVRLEAAAVDVLVIEGKVAVDQSVGAVAPNRPPSQAVEGNGPYQSAPAATVLSAGERAVVSLAPEAQAPAVQTVSAAEIEARLAWQPRLLDFTSAPLSEIAAEFNRRNPVRLTVGDPRLSTLRLSATFRSDNVEGFVRLMESDFGLRAERRGGGEIVLVLAAPEPR